MATMLPVSHGGGGGGGDAGGGVASWATGGSSGAVPKVEEMDVAQQKSMSNGTKEAKYGKLLCEEWKIVNDMLFSDSGLPAPSLQHTRGALPVLEQMGEVRREAIYEREDYYVAHRRPWR